MSSKALTRQESDLLLHQKVNDITTKVMDRVHRVITEDDPTKLWTDHTVADQYALEVYKQTMANRRENMATARALGVIVLKNRMEEADWEKRAAEVDAGVIDVEPAE